MSINATDEAQRKAAKVAGLACLITFTTMVSVNFSNLMQAEGTI